MSRQRGENSGRALQLFYKQQGLCERCGKGPRVGSQYCQQCKDRHRVTNDRSKERQKIYKLIDELFLFIEPKNKDVAIEQINNIKKRIKALSSCYREHAD